MNTTTDTTSQIDKQHTGAGACAVTAVVVRLAGELRPAHSASTTATG